jgi:spore maturation protein CgeB
LVIKGEHLAGETVRALRDFHGCPVINFYPDDPFSQMRGNRMSYGAASVLPAYDACFTFARHLVPAIRSTGASRVHYLPFARDPEIHAPPEVPQQQRFDLVFAGNLDAERVRWLEPLVRFKLAIFGEHTRRAVPRESPLAQAQFYPAAYEGGLAHALALGRISLNIMREQNAGSHNMRSYESPACGAFTLSQRTSELMELFREGEEVAGFGSREELVDQVEKWLGNPGARRKIAEAGFRRVEHDTYDTRAAEMLRLVQVGSYSTV